ncbi:hypothetical protein bthur0003_62510 [Bacillus thuringiensis serovar thuringiensis str. T01001]|uniref:hypothetical protein n=1 Tax=Bacillus thuringiensis TaxID=1428 RepID=UPI0001A1815C|nr:hypothetical protein [Bacillus thuringiensis]AGG04350.1 hypothetical protein H175_8p13 [Bacillus thuringiensis serovar thuringiensis str. IS5056]EEM31284.1 hypothetical protein bthur0003_62510 [Bacillus thuringiensis serovar thuringiensis str. T01001]EEM62293.1 hypothetical protein bthur0008_61440 [Bacillus thuringiensis serovar berliner ATCC 10792]
MVEALPVKQKNNYVCRGSSHSTTKKFPWIVGGVKKMASVGEDILQGSGDIMLSW